MSQSVTEETNDSHDERWSIREVRGFPVISYRSGILLMWCWRSLQEFAMPLSQPHADCRSHLCFRLIGSIDLKLIMRNARSVISRQLLGARRE